MKVVHGKCLCCGGGLRWGGVFVCVLGTLAFGGLRGEYFDNADLTGFASERVDPVVDFEDGDWGSCPPGTAVVCDDVYSERWTGYVHIPTAGDWTFYTVSNDGVRLWVAEMLIIDHWGQHTAAEDSAAIDLSAGWHPIVLEHFQNAGTVVIQLLFSGPGQAKAIIPDSHTSPTGPGYPQADAGEDQYLVLPEDAVVLHGSGTDAGGSIVGWLWEQVSGPAAAMSGADTADLSLTGLVAATYVFRLTVTDNEGLTDSDEATVTVSEPGSGNVVVTGELKVWHKVTLTLDGPASGEQATPNPFLDYRFEVTFTKGGKTYKAPGYFAADGNAANTSAADGNKWRAHFAADEAGMWTYVISFRQGTNVAVADEPLAGAALAPYDGTVGQLEIAPTDKTGRDLRGKGRLDYVGIRYLRHAGTGEYFLKCGADAPENLLAYADFDGGFKTDGQGDTYIKTWSAHVADWRPGDPAWQGGKGKGLIGAINYLASEGLNAFSFIPMNINGDDKNVFPYTTYQERYRMDVSRLDQWEMVFEHGDRMGMYLHFKTQETENELLLDGGNMGTQRKLYYRELIARFGHHLALNWNLGEEIDNASTEQKKAWAQYFYDHDPYHHHIVIHNGANHYDLMGPGSKLTGFSLQTGRADFAEVHSSTLNYINRSVAAGKPWVVACDEPGDASHALRPDDDAGNSHVDGRKGALWGNIMAGGAGLEFYFGYAHAHSDLTCQDFRSRDSFWDYCRYALEFFKDNRVPFWEMVNDDGLSTNTDDYCFYKEGEIYMVYLKNGGTTDITLPEGQYSVYWYNPRAGGDLQTGNVSRLSGGGRVNIGAPPADAAQDWLAVIRAGQPLLADLNRDGWVNLGDVAIVAADWMQCNDPADAECESVF